MINLNGVLVEKEQGQISFDNRAFKYGDALFETVKIVNGKVVFVEDHYFRLMASMRMLRMHISMALTLEFFQGEIEKTVKANGVQNGKARVSIYRAGKGLYTPTTHRVEYIVEVTEGVFTAKEDYKIDLYKDFYVQPSLLSNVKTTNRMLNVLAGIYAEENQLDNCVLLNDAKGAVEFVNGNLFLLKGTEIITPPLTDGCIKGITRKKLIDLFENHTDYTLVQKTISPFEIQKADGVFVTNAVVGIQPVTQYRKKKFDVALLQPIVEKYTSLI